VGRHAIVVGGLLIGCSAEAPGPAQTDWPAVPPKETREVVREAKVPFPPEDPGSPAAVSVPTALARPEFLARDSACKRATVKRMPACAGEWTAACDKELLAAAYTSPQSQATTGGCYYHDRAGCPECACDYYVKVHKQGFDGGTGCLGTPEDVLMNLYAECAAQRCEAR
jgi:hypothetical protein